jgi:hypothetical protein
VEELMNNAEKAIVEQLSPKLTELGFKWVKSRSVYVRRETFGFSSFCWASHTTHDEGGRLEITPLLGVRHDVVENVVNQLGLINGEENQRYTPTVEQGLSYFPLREGIVYTQFVRLSSADLDIQNVVSSFTALLEGEGDDFFKKYSSIESCSHGLNSVIEAKTHPLCNNFPLRAYYGIATAKLSEPKRVSELADKYLQYAKTVSLLQYEKIEKRVTQLLTLV